MPGQQPGEGQGRLLNAFCEVDGGLKTWRPVPGSVEFVDLTTDGPRGMMVADNLLYCAQEGLVKTVSTNGVITTLTGALSGTLPVTWAQNNKTPTRDVVVVSENGCFSVSTAAVTSFADADLPQPNSVCALDGYFIWTTGNGQIWASDLNDITVDALSFTTAQGSPDGLLRGTASGGQFFAWGNTSCEVYQNVGTSPFPLARVTVIPVGLIGTWAIAGSTEGWDTDQVFVAADGTVRRMKGYEPVHVSTKDVERDIQSITDKETLIATVYVFDGHPIWSLSSPSWTWEYNLETGFWHERQTSNSRWKGSQSAYFNSKWVVGDNAGSKLLYIDSTEYEDDGSAITMTLESGPVKDFPNRVFVSMAAFDFTTGTAPISGTEDETNPTVSVSWSRDGGGTWSNAVQTRSLGSQGELSNEIRVNRIGVSTHHGMRFRLQTSSPVYRTFRGGRCEASARAPA
jgi:hypothetical protein